MNDLEIIVQEQAAIITTNFGEVRDNLASITKAYEGLTYTEDLVPDARADVATLRKIRKVIDDKKKALKKEHDIPYIEFESNCKELCKMIDDVIDPINKQIDEYTEAKKLEKKNKIIEYFEYARGTYKFVDISDVWNDKWISNMSTTMKYIKAEIGTYLTKIDEEYDAINSSDSEAVEKALENYRANKNLALAMQIINDYEKQKAEILAREEARRKAEEERKSQELEAERVRKVREEIEAEEIRQSETLAKTYADETANVVDETEGFDVSDTVVSGFGIDETEGFKVSEESKNITIRALANNSQIELLRSYMESIDIKFIIQE